VSPPRTAVEELAKDVSMTGVAGGLFEEMEKDPAHGHGRAVVERPALGIEVRVGTSTVSRSPA
jgi:hypothetical protein